jgi:hypothetical protein
MPSKPIRVYFLTDDGAGLFEQGQTADDLGSENPGSNVHLLKLDHFDIPVALEDPYGRGLIARLPADDPDQAKPKGFSDAELDEYLDSREDDDEGE